MAVRGRKVPGKGQVQWSRSAVCFRGYKEASVTEQSEPGEEC